GSGRQGAGGRRQALARGTCVPEAAGRPEIETLGPSLERKRHADEQEQAPDPARREPRADPCRPEKSVRSEERRSRLEIACRVLARDELVDPPGLERGSCVNARPERRGKPPHLVEVAQGCEHPLLPGERVARIGGQAEWSAQVEAIVSGKVGVEVRPAV